MRKKLEKPTLGWREWIDFPALQIDGVKAKIDTGARSSALHAEQVEIVRTADGAMVNFVVHPLQRDRSIVVRCQAPLYDERWIRSSNGKRERRPVIRTPIHWGAHSWEIDLTLTSRDVMGFRMLLGREALRNRFLINPGRSFLGGKPRGKSKASS